MVFVMPPTYRASILCHHLELLNSSIKNSIAIERPDLWSMVLNEYNLNNYGKKRKKSNPTFATSNPRLTSMKSLQAAPRRISRRIHERRTMKQRVQEAHLRLIEKTEVAHYYVTEMAHSQTNSLSLKALRSTFNQYGGPLIRYNHRALVGGTFLIECCRARHIKESVIVSCAKELLEKCGANPNVSSGVGPAENGKGGLTPLCIASARGMSLLVRYLLKRGASKELKGTGSFRLFSNPNKSISGTFTPIEFAKTMRNAEVKCGVDLNDLRSLDQCIKMLSKKT